MTGPKSYYRIVCENRKARHDYNIEHSLEAGICLRGTEVKSLRTNKVMIAESYVAEQDGELYLINAHIPEYVEANRFNHSAKRPRKLLLHKRELRKLIGAITTKGKTIIPLKLYFNNNNIAKVEIAVGTGKKKYDKRQALKEKDLNREKQRLLKGE